jgi:carbon storage regulator CsrA
MALVLSRKLDQGIVFGESITVRVIRLSSNEVRLAIDAPLSVNIRREELSPREPKTAGV